MENTLRFDLDPDLALILIRHVNKMAELHASTSDTAEFESQPTKPDPVLNNLIWENPIIRK